VGERFYRADASGKVPGTGLGMSIVKEIMALHGGSVRIQSTPGRGTTVTLLLTEGRVAGTNMA
jgi:signal transduction histidine kinase